jgi:hypothetical protein
VNAYLVLVRALSHDVPIKLFAGRKEALDYISSLTQEWVEEYVIDGPTASIDDSQLLGISLVTYSEGTPVSDEWIVDYA